MTVKQTPDARVAGSAVAAEAVLFDLDGTLVDTEPRNHAVWALLLARHGVPAHGPAPADFSGRTAREAIAAHLEWFPGRSVDGLLAEVLASVREPGLPVPAPMPGAVRLVRRLAAAAVPLGVVTSATRELAESELAAAGIIEYFDVLVTAEDVRRGKPDPEGYRAACAVLGVRPERVVVFEDSPVGLAAARLAGAYCVRVLTGTDPAAPAAADQTVRTLAEVRWPLRAATGPEPR
jgi:sugar-phosphatase